MTTGEIVAVLVVARPGPLRESLQILLTSMPQVRSVGEASDAASALDLLTRNDPGLVLLDADLPDDDAWALLSQIKVQWPQVRCLVLVDSCPDRERAEALAVGGVMPKGGPPARLAEVIEVLLLGATKLMHLGEQGGYGANEREGCQERQGGTAAETEGSYSHGSGGTA